MRPKIDRNPVYNIIKELKLRSIFSDSNLEIIQSNTERLGSFSDRNWEQLGKILGNSNYRRVTWYFLEKGAASDLILQHALGMPEGSIRRIRRQLGTWEIISPAMRGPKNAKGGPIAKIHQIPSAEPEQVVEALNYHKKLLSPKYVVAERMAQVILDDYATSSEINYRDIMDTLVSHNVGRNIDVADLTAQHLTLKGMKVYR